MNKTIALALAGLAIIASAQNALAQNAVPAQQDAAAISDADIKAYAAVAAKANALQADASLSEADKNAQLAAAVKASGMAPAKIQCNHRGEQDGSAAKAEDSRSDGQVTGRR